MAVQQEINILYHHRTRGTDAQRVHIKEMIQAFRGLGHRVEVAGLADIEGPQDAARDAGEALWKKFLRRLPFAYELAQLAYNLIGLPMLLWRLLTGRVDFIYERYSLFNFAGVLAARLYGAPIVLEVNSPFAFEQHRDKDIRAFSLARWAERVICNSASKVIVVSSPLRRMMVDAGVDPGRIVVMPNGVNLDHFQRRTRETELRESIGIGDRTVIGFAGWFRNWHGLELLLEAFQKSQLAQQGAVVLLIGDGPAMSDVRGYVQRHRLRDSVIFTGPLPHDQMPLFVDLIDVAVQPAANEYCCPMKILEYMALGKPIVAPRQENIQDLLREGFEGEFFSPGDSADLSRALARLVADPLRARLMGQRAQAAIHERGYLWSRNAGRVLDMVVGPSLESSEEKVVHPLPM